MGSHFIHPDFNILNYNAHHYALSPVSLVGFAVVVLDNPIDKVCGVLKRTVYSAGRDVGLAGDVARRVPVE
jgi:hypothetical protein